MNNNTPSLWQKIQQSLLAIAPSIGESFQKPAEEAQIKALEEVIAQPLPESFKQYLHRSQSCCQWGERTGNYAIPWDRLPK